MVSPSSCIPIVQSISDTTSSVWEDAKGLQVRTESSFNSSQAKERMRRSSFWNWEHHEWVIDQDEKLLKHDGFRSVMRAGATGTIIIETPYSGAVRQYDVWMKQLPGEWQDRLQVLSVDKTQGNQADVIILNMVRTTTVGFMDNPQRLNVAITRARQTEIIVMHHMMTTSSFRKHSMGTRYTS